MVINLQSLLHLPVFTKSGTNLGKVHDLKIDVDTHAIKQYIVESGLIAKHHYLIGPAQVIEITEEKIVVDDTITKDVVIKEEKQKSAPPEAALGGAVTPMKHK
ncbi:MAG TPA: PRC-barrel domain-containing protein [Patescibacteria group bacterium]|nr:PRC-barrel domain-containing protein [Patescibacteria group bacterium]